MTPIFPAVHTKPTKLALLFSGSILALSMTGCGGGGDGSNSGNSDNGSTTPPVSSASFSETATWQVTNLSLIHI